MRAALTIMAAAMALAGCNKAHEEPPANAVAFTPPPPQRATALPGQAPTTPITAHVGKYPKDAVDGVAFFDRTDVATALNDAVIDAKVRRRISSGNGPQTPIFARGDSVGAWGCQAHDCSENNWTLLIDTKSKKAQACYHDTATMGDTARWYAGAAPVTKPGDCPSGDPPA